ncbi:hypothetical protein BH23PLA1_BH23PLA1_35210 [soil metagenome]
MRQDQGRRYRVVVMALVVAIAWQGGCRQLDRPSRRGGLSWEEHKAQEPSRITKAQEADLHVSIGRSAESHGDVAMAMSAYQEAVNRDRSRADAFLRMAVLHDQKGQYRESADLYRKALEVDPGNADIYCDLGYSEYLQRRWAEAERNLRQALALTLNDEHPRALNNLGLVLAHDGRHDEALTAFRQAGSNPAQARENLAFALSLEGRWEQAREQYQLAMAADSHSQTPRERLQELDSLMAQLNPNPNGSTLPSATLHDPEVQTVRALQPPKIPAESRAPASIDSPVLLNVSPRSAATNIPPPRTPRLPETP